MSLDYAILGFLNYQPCSGYDLKKVFDLSIKHFWTADQSQIYRTLARLTREGLAAMRIVEQSERPDRKEYSITAAGRAALVKWLAGPPPFTGTRSSPLVQVFFLGQLDDAEVLAKLRGYAEIMRHLLAQYEKAPPAADWLEGEMGSPREKFFWLLTLDNGLRNMRANLEWVEEAIRRIDAGELPPRDAS